MPSGQLHDVLPLWWAETASIDKPSAEGVCRSESAPFIINDLADSDNHDEEVLQCPEWNSVIQNSLIALLFWSQNHIPLLTNVLSYMVFRY